MKDRPLFSPTALAGDAAGLPARSRRGPSLHLVSATTWGFQEADRQWRSLSPLQRQWALALADGVSSRELAEQARLTMYEMRAQRARILLHLRASTLLELRLLLAALVPRRCTAEADRRSSRDSVNIS